MNRKSRIALPTCFCCGEKERDSGCVRRPACRCRTTHQCALCKHCLDHHVEGCSPEARAQAAQIISDVRIIEMQRLDELRKKHGINIFAKGGNTGSNLPLRSPDLIKRK